MKKFALVAALSAFSATSAVALDAHYSKETTASPAKAWETIGDFCGISTWHPALEKCELLKTGDATQRKLFLKGGGTILEQLVEQNDETMTQTYVILEGVLPVANYKSTLKVVPKDNGAVYDWSGSFDAKGAEDAESKKVISGVYSAGVDALVKKSTD